MLHLITAPATEPVSTATEKTFLRVDGTDEDTLIASLVKAARETVEELARRALITQTWEMTLNAWPENGALELLRPPLQSVESVKYMDEDGIEHTWTDYIVDTAAEPGRIVFDSYPGETLLESGAITVQYVAGYGDSADDVPERIKNAIMRLAAHWYEYRESADVPTDIQRLIMSERVVWF